MTYGRIVVDYLPREDDTYRTCLTVGGNLIKYRGEASTQTSDIKMAKLLLNITISTLEACFMCCNIKILSWDPHGTLWIYLTSNQHHTGVNNNTIQPQKYGGKWTCLCLYRKINVWTATDRYNSKLFPYKNSCTTGILSVLAQLAYGGTNVDQWFFLWLWMILESNMSGSNMRSTLLHASKNIILYQYIGMGNYILYLVLIGTINKSI